MKVFNVEKPVKKIVAILHECNIPLSGLNVVFKRVEEDILSNAIPYDPMISVAELNELRNRKEMIDSIRTQRQSEGPPCDK